jgi:hypothetical protein
MKKISIYSIFLVLVIGTGITACKKDTSASKQISPAKEQTPIKSNPLANVPDNDPRYGIESGVIEFGAEAFGKQYKEIVYFDDFGRKEAIFVYNRQDPEKIDRLTIYNDTINYTIRNFESKKAKRKIFNPAKKQMDYQRLQETRGGKENADHYLSRFMMFYEGSEKVMNYDCDKYVIKLGKDPNYQWFHKGILLKTQQKSTLVVNNKQVDSSFGKEAVRFDVNAEVDPKIFDLPVGFTY